MFGGALGEALDAEGLAVLHQAGERDFVGQIIDVLALSLDIPLLGDSLELLRVLDLIGAALFGQIQGVGDGTAVVRVGGGAAGGEPQVVPGNDAMDVAAADAARGLLGDAAGAHGADPAAGTCFAEAAVGGLVLDALLPGIRADLGAGFQQAGSRFFHLIDCD